MEDKIDSDNSDNEYFSETENLDTEDVDNSCIYEDIDNDYTNLDKEIITVDNSERITRNYLTYFEFVRIIGERTKQLTMGAKPMIKYDESLSYEEIAIEELKLDSLPFKIKRYIPHQYEIWNLNELKKDHLMSFLN